MRLLHNVVDLTKIFLKSAKITHWALVPTDASDNSNSLTIEKMAEFYYYSVNSLTAVPNQTKVIPGDQRKQDHSVRQ